MLPWRGLGVRGGAGVTIRPGDEWGAPTDEAADVVVRGDDRALAAALADLDASALVEFRPDAASDFARAIGLGPGDAPRRAVEQVAEVGGPLAQPHLGGQHAGGLHLQRQRGLGAREALGPAKLQHQPVEVFLKNFTAHDNGIYINVANPSPIVKLLKSLHACLGLQRSQSHYVWHPHISIAQGLTAGKFEEATPAYANTEYASSFIADHIQLLKRDSTHDNFILLNEFELSCMVRV